MRSANRDRILDAAERLLERGAAAFSMRELAEEAELSFATPFNQFGSKGAIMLALSGRRIDAMHARLAETALPEAAPARVLATAELAAAVMLDRPAASRAVMAAIGAPGEPPGTVALRSAALWATALGTGSGLAAATRSLGLAVLPLQLAIAFRGVLSFWTAGELPDPQLTDRAVASTAAALLGFSGRDARPGLVAVLSVAARREQKPGLGGADPD